MDDGVASVPASPFARLRARDLFGLTIALMGALMLAMLSISSIAGISPDERLIGLALAPALGLPALFLGRRAGLVWTRLFGAAPTRSELLLVLVVVPVALLTMADAYLVYVPLSYLAPRFVERQLLNQSFYDVTTVWQWVALMLMGVGLAPALEEILFRGVLMQRWSYRWGTSTGVIASSALFAVLHGEWIGHFFFGVAMSALYLRTRKLWVPMAAHALNNFVFIAPSLYGVLRHHPPATETLAEFRAEFWTGVPMLAAAAVAYLVYRRVLWKGTGLRELLRGASPYDASGARDGFSPVRLMFDDR